MTPVDLEGELLWGLEIIRQSLPELNEFLKIRDQAQQAFALQNLDEVLALSDRMLNKTGWSFCALDLKVAAMQRLSGSAEAKAYLSELRAGAGRAPLALYCTILMDRIDDAYSFGSFRAKLNRSKESFNPDWYRMLICYRSSGEVTSPLNDFPVILSVDIMSSLVDYYESFVDCIMSVVQDDRLADLVETTAGILNQLADIGIADSRIKAIISFVKRAEFVADEIGVARVPPSLEAAILYRTVQMTADSEQRNDEISSEDEYVEEAVARLSSLCSMVENATCQGMAGDDLEALIKIGLNFKSIPMGPALVYRAMMTFNIADDDPILPLPVVLGAAFPGVEKMLCYPDDVIAKWVCSGDQSSTSDLGGLPIVNFAKEVIGGKCLNLDEVDVQPSLLVLWLARYLVRSGKYDSALKICDIMDGFGAKWMLVSAKVRMRAHVENGNLIDAVDLAAGLLITNYQYSYELPLASIFAASNWKDFSGSNRHALGIVSHYANVNKPSGTARFICRMCCRELFKSSDRSSLDNKWNSMGLTAQRLAVAFYEDVWVEENLALVDDLKSTHDVRRDRVSVYQNLLAWNSDDEAKYSENIRQLTLDETLWNGLKYLDENRLFVNDSAITRWAEKELLLAYERSRRISIEGGGASLDEDSIRTYLINPSVENLINALPPASATEANASLLELVQRLRDRFIGDPADGLESYLSLRIRHGTLRGTILGPLEQAGLLITGTFSESAFEAKWFGAADAVGSGKLVVDELRGFSKSIGDVVKALVDERVQVQSKAKPSGAFKIIMDPSSALSLVGVFNSGASFHEFVYACYQVFWRALARPREDLARHVSIQVKGELQGCFDDAIARLDSIGAPSIVSALRLAATQTQQQCDIASRWFTNKSDHVDQHYPLDVAIDIAGKATKSIYRGFPSKLELDHSRAGGISLTSNGLAVLYDCLFVAFENAWKHSGLAENLGAISISLDFNRDAGALDVSVSSPLSDERAAYLTEAEIEKVRSAFYDPSSGDAVSKEGGSGFAKLAKAVRIARRAGNARALDVTVEDKVWTVMFSIPMYERGGAYDAFL